MVDPYIGEIRVFAGNFAPVGWLICNGSLLPINQNEALYTLLGTTYGGDGVTTFALPNLQSRIPIGQGSGPGLTTRVLGQTGGVENVTLVESQIPVHTHTISASTATSGSVNGATSATYLGVASSAQANPVAYLPNGTGVGTSALAPQTISGTGGSQPHANIQPYIAVNYIIATNGQYPTQN